MSNLTPPLSCPDCGESFEDAEEDHRLKYRKRHREQHDRWISVDEFSQDGRDDIAECEDCGMRQYRENWEGECLKCGADVSRNSQGGQAE